MQPLTFHDLSVKIKLCLRRCEYMHSICIVAAADLLKFAEITHDSWETWCDLISLQPAILVQDRQRLRQVLLWRADLSAPSAHVSKHEILRFLLISLLCIFFRHFTVLVTQTAVWVLHEWARSRPMTHLAIFFLFFLCFEWKKGIRDADPRFWSCSTNGCFLLALDPQRLEKCHCRLSFFLDCLLWLCGATVLHFWFTCFLLKPLPVLHCCSCGKWQMSRMNARWTIIEWKQRAAALQSTLECWTFFHPFLGATNILSDGDSHGMGCSGSLEDLAAAAGWWESVDGGPAAIWWFCSILISWQQAQARATLKWQTWRDRSDNRRCLVFGVFQSCEDIFMSMVDACLASSDMRSLLEVFQEVRSWLPGFPRATVAFSLAVKMAMQLQQLDLALECLV